MARVFHIAVLFLPALLAAVLLQGCTKDELHEAAPIVEEKPEAAGMVYLRFRMNLPADTRSATAATRTEPFVDGSDRENAVNRVDLLIYDAESDKLTDFIRLDAEQTAQIISATGVTVPVYAPASSRARIYVSVNSPDGLADQLLIGREGHDFIVSSALADYWNVINAFVPGTDGKQEMLESGPAGEGGIPMTGQFTLAGSGSDVIAIESLNPVSGGTGTQTLTASVERVVAKVHVLAQGKNYTTSGGAVFYCNAQGTAAVSELTDADYANWIGWIRLSDVRYMPNSTNRSTYLFPKMNGSTPMDPNMDLMSYLLNGALDATLCLRDYVYYTSLAMHRENISPNCHLGQAEGFTPSDTDLSASPDPQNYRKGMYCLENYFDLPPQSPNPLDAMDYPLPMVTHVSIVAKLTPRNIVLLTDYKRSMDTFVANSRANATEYERKYGFTQEEADHWENVIKPRYFLAQNETGGIMLDKEGNPVDREYPIYRGQYNIIKVNTEEDAKYILSWSLKAREIWTADPADFESDKWSDGTFYVYDTVWDEKAGVTVTEEDKKLWSQKYLYFAPGAVFGKAADSDEFVDNPTAAAAKTYGVPHLCGWGYYYTYIDAPSYSEATSATTPSPSSGRPAYTVSQVTRNHYYLLNVRNFGSPGGTITRPEYIKVNTEPVDWDYTGQGNVQLH